MLRWWLGMKFNPMHHAIPIGTLIANLLGAFIIGAGLAWFNRLTHVDPMWKLLITTGFCGGLTTFSTFSAEVVFLLQQAFQLGIVKRAGQSTGFFRHDRDGILAVLTVSRPLTTGKTRYKRVLYSTDALVR